MKSSETQRVWRSAVGLVLSSTLGGMPPPEAAARLAADFRMSLDVHGWLDLAKACQEARLALNYKPLQNDALLREVENGYEATINSRSTKTRQRFSIAHELGHIKIYLATKLSEAFGHLAPSLSDISESKEIEDLCNCFGSELLMPIEEWRRELSKFGISIPVINRLMKTYEVSIQAAIERAVEAGTYKCAFILWEQTLDDSTLLKVRPIYFASNIRLGVSRWPLSLTDDQDCASPGSPLLSIKKKGVTVGEILPPFEGATEKYLAQSDMVWGHTGVPLVLTLLLAEPAPRGLLRKAELAKRYRSHMR